MYDLNSQQVLQKFGQEAGAAEAMEVDGAGAANGDAAGGTAAGSENGLKEGAKAGGLKAEAAPVHAVLCVDAHPQRPLLASCGRYQEHVVKLWEHSSA